LAPHEKLFIDYEFLEEDEDHGEIGCVTCHGGNPDDPNWKTAHKDLVKDPSFPEPDACIECHEEESENYSQNLHISNRPMYLMVMARASADPTIQARLNTAHKAHCTQCHSSCGQCHLSRPGSVGGGLLSGHLLVKEPPMEEVCTACHGSRVGNEYLGKNAKCSPDVHYIKGRMKCKDCHAPDQMHGDGKQYPHRYAVENSPTCIGCHKEIYSSAAQNRDQHTTNKDSVSCQVCHSQAYTNCFGCHVAKTKEDQKYFEVESHSIGFKIGLNPNQSKKHPEKYVTVRHVPVDHDTFDFYVKDALSNFDVQPTWKMATPHNIQRKTAQNSACNNCHGNSRLFLLKTAIRSGYLNANRPVIVSYEEIPDRIEKKDMPIRK